MIPADQIDVDAVKASRQGTPTPGALARLGRQFPGSWLAFGQEQIVRCADPHFRLLASTSGRLDYIETIRQWNARIGTPSFRKTLLKLRRLPR